MEVAHISQTALDQLVCTEHSQLLKASVPYLSGQSQQVCSILVKAMELSNTLSLFKNMPSQIHIQSIENTDDPLDILKDIEQYSYGESKNRIQQIIQAFGIMELFQLMNQTSSDQEYV